MNGVANDTTEERTGTACVMCRRVPRDQSASEANNSVASNAPQPAPPRTLLLRRARQLAVDHRARPPTRVMKSRRFIGRSVRPKDLLHRTLAVRGHRKDYATPCFFALKLRTTYKQF